MKNLEWIESGGGPLLLASETLVAQWRGVESVDDLDRQTDYERACAVHDEIGTIALGGGQAVVFGDEPDRTAMFVHGHDLIVVRWRWANSEDELVSALMGFIDRLDFCHSGIFSTVAGSHRLFDSACSGDDIAQSTRVVLEAGDYELEIAHFAPADSMNALVHRLRRQ